MTLRLRSGRAAARIGIRVAGTILLALMLPRASAAQDPLQQRRLEAGATISWTTQSTLGSQSAILTRNSGTDSTPFILFATDARVEPAPSLSASFSYRLTNWITAEAAGHLRRPDVAISVRNDAEGASNQTIVGERFDEYVIDGSALIRLPLKLGSKVWPFAMVGGGYRREIHGDGTLIDAGTSFHAGGGLKWIASSKRRGWIRGIGVRADARVVQRRGGFRLDRASDVSTAAGGGVFFVF